MEFYRAEPTPLTSWRMAILMGANSRTYKFALGHALIRLAQTGHERVSLDELAIPYASALAEHAERFPQGPAEAIRGSTDFLAVLAEEGPATRNAGEPTERLVEAATKSMPGMVMQKFHNLRGLGGEVPHTFYRLKRDGPRVYVELLPELRQVAEHDAVLGAELDARWCIVEACFDAGIGRSLVQRGVALGPDGETLLTWARRAPVATAREALLGFQHGRCFFCKGRVTTFEDVHVDHLYPYALMKTGSWRGPDLNGVWNLVVACSACNLRKSSRLPTPEEVAGLMVRNEAVVGSPHPLRRTLELSMAASGKAATTAAARAAFIRAVEAATPFAA